VIDIYADAVQTYSLIELQKKADDWLCYACGYSHDRAQDDPVYKVVTENRDPFPKLLPAIPVAAIWRIGCLRVWACAKRGSIAGSSRTIASE